MIKKIVITLLLSITALVATAQTNKVGLSWDATCNTNVASYVIYYGTNVLATPVTRIDPSHIDVPSTFHRLF